MLNKRQFFLGFGAVAAASNPSFVWASKQASKVQAAAQAEFSKAMRALEKTAGGRLGVAVHDVQTGAAWQWRGADRFPMCSTFKATLAAQALAAADRGELHLDKRVRFERSALVEYSPVTELHAGKPEGLSLRELCEAIVVISDNTAANLLLEELGGPAGHTRFMRSIGDTLTRLDRNEPTMSNCTPGDVRDTTTPQAMLLSLQRISQDNKVLKAASREQWLNWLIACKTGNNTLRAGAPGWRVGDKTGAGPATRNDVAILWRPSADAAVAASAKPLFISTYLTECQAKPEVRDATLAGVARETIRLIGEIA